MNNNWMEQAKCTIRVNNVWLMTRKKNKLKVHHLKVRKCGKCLGIIYKILKKCVMKLIKKNGY